MPILRKTGSILRFAVVTALLAVPLTLAILRPALLAQNPDTVYPSDCTLGVGCTDGAVIAPTPGSCANGIECSSLAEGCASSGSCDVTGSGSCVSKSCRVTATNAQIEAAGNCTADSCFSPWYRTADGYEVRFHKYEGCDPSSSPEGCWRTLYTYQIRPATESPAGGGGGGGGGGSWCGNGSCNPGETCATCPADCGVCATCGNGYCGTGETCATCPQGCGICTGDVTARAVYLDDPAPTCDEVRAASSMNGLTFSHTLTLSTGWSQTNTQTTSSYVSWPLTPVESLSLSVSPSTILPITRACHRKTNPAEDGHSLHTNLAAGQFYSKTTGKISHLCI